MRSSSLRAFLADQAAATFRHYKGEDFLGNRTLWIAVRNPEVLVQRLGGMAPKELPGFSLSEAFVYTRPDGHNELWADPTLPRHRQATLTFVEKLGGVRLTSAESRILDSDHAFTRGASRVQGTVYSTEVGYVRMNLIDATANRSWGAGFERRHSHRNFTHELYCEANFLDVIKALGGYPRAWTDPEAIVRDGIKYLQGEGYLGENEGTKLWSIARAEVLASIQASDEAYAETTGQVDLSEERR